MKVKKKYSYTDKRQVWRLLLSESEKLIIESRDTDKKEVFYHCLDLFSGEKIFKNYQPDEKYWISIEAVYDDIIFFHKYAKPDMPGHRFIQAFDINSQRILWENDKYVFIFIDEKGLYSLEKTISGNKYCLLDYKTGEIKEELDIEEADIMKLNQKSADSKDFSNYLFPEKYFTNFETALEKNDLGSIQKEINLLEIVGPVEYVIKEKLVVFNFHFRNKGKITNRLIAKEIDSDKIIYDSVLNKEVNAFAPDSFFVYKNLLLHLSEKTEVVVSQLIGRK